jgi:GH15 family glucan-1,4-alpha-glucosidase
MVRAPRVGAQHVQPSRSKVRRIRRGVKADQREATTRVRRHGAIVRSCMPRFDSSPIFASLLDQSSGGEFLIGPADGGPGVHLYRPNTNVLEVAFMLCTFWLIEALATLGRVDEARMLMGQLHSVHAPLGLLAEDLDPTSGVMWGNYPQASSHVGSIHSAFAAAPRWSEFA